MKSDTQYNNFLTERFGNHFWNQVIYHSIQNDEFLKKTATKIPIEVFGSREKKLIIKMIHDFYYEYKTAPKDNFYDLFKEAERTMSADLYNKCMNVISVLKEITGSNWEYITDKIDEAIRHYRLEEASVEFASLIKNKKYDDAKVVILEAMRNKEDEEADYFDYFTDQTYIEKRLSVQRHKMKTMIPGLDDLIGGFNPPWLITFLGTPKSGKCLKGDSLITFAGGHHKTIKDVVENKIYGDVVSYNEKSKKLEKSKIVSHKYNGKKECFKITTKTGRTIEATDNHPFLTTIGWKQLKELSVGSFIAAPKNLANILNSKEIMDFCNSDIFYDEIVSISSTGIHDVYDISLDKNYNFVANNIIVHNSFLLLEMAIAGVLQGLNVFFVSLEMDKKVIEDRLDQIIGFMSSKEKEGIQETMTYKKDYWVKSKNQTKSIYDIQQVERNRKKIKKIGGGNLKITAHHRARMNHFDIERLLDEAEHKEGFIPDLVIVDYLGIMRETSQGQSKKERISENCLGLKELCGRRKVIGITAMQGNRTAMTSKTFQPHMVADDIDTIHHCDMALAICQTAKEDLENKFRLYLAIYRHGAQGQSIGVIKDLTIGQIALDTFAIKEEEFNNDDDKQGKGDYF